jgi:hypothetical protein
MDQDAIDTTVKPSGTGCAECDSAGGWWFHLRRCAECGHVGCCDSSPGRHATGHWKETGHPLMQSFEPGEDWFFSFEDGNSYDGPELAAPTSHPEAQSVPGPQERVPSDWMDHLHR